MLKCGDVETWKQRDVEAQRRGGTETWGHSDIDRDIETWRHRNMDTEGNGGTVI